MRPCHVRVRAELLEGGDRSRQLAGRRPVLRKPEPNARGIEQPMLAIQDSERGRSSDEVPFRQLDGRACATGQARELVDGGPQHRATDFGLDQVTGTEHVRGNGRAELGEQLQPVADVRGRGIARPPRR